MSTGVVGRSRPEGFCHRSWRGSRRAQNVELHDFDDWVVRAVLNPARPLFREARYLLAEDPDLRDTALYHSVLAAVAEGNASRGGIAGYIGRKATDLQHPLTVLQDAGLLLREPDPFRSGRSSYRITEPLITFYQAIMRPAWTALEQRRGADVWRRSQRRYASAVLGTPLRGDRPPVVTALRGSRHPGWTCRGGERRHAHRSGQSKESRTRPGRPRRTAVG
jgi:hypothetical protein